MFLDLARIHNGRAACLRACPVLRGWFVGIRESQHLAKERVYHPLREDLWQSRENPGMLAHAVADTRTARGERMLHGISDDIGRASVLLHLVPAPSHLPDEGSVLRLSFGRQIADDLLQVSQSFVHSRGGNRAGLDGNYADSRGMHLQPQGVADLGKR